MGAQEPEEPFSRAGLGTVVRPPPKPNKLATCDHLDLRPMEADDGLSHHGDPAEEEEVIVVEEPERAEEEESFLGESSEEHDRLERTPVQRSSRDA